MKHFRTLAQTKKDWETLQNRVAQTEEYISLIENYTPQTFTQHVIHQYIHEGSTIRTAENLNRLEITIDGRPVEKRMFPPLSRVAPPLTIYYIKKYADCI